MYREVPPYACSRAPGEKATVVIIYSCSALKFLNESLIVIDRGGRGDHVADEVKALCLLEIPGPHSSFSGAVTSSLAIFCIVLSFHGLERSPVP